MTYSNGPLIAIHLTAYRVKPYHALILINLKETASRALADREGKMCYEAQLGYSKLVFKKGVVVV